MVASYTGIRYGAWAGKPGDLNVRNFYCKYIASLNTFEYDSSMEILLTFFKSNAV